MGINKKYQIKVDDETADGLVAAVLRRGLKYWRKDSKTDVYYERLVSAAEIIIKHFTV
jgi:hypothetical protein